MMNKYSIFSLLIAVAAVFCAKAETYEITAGELRDALPEDPSGLTELVLSGTMNAVDFETINESLPALTSLDIQNVSIEPVTTVKPILGSGYGFLKNELPAGALFGKGLTSLTLPSTITVIGQNALANNNFATIEIPASVTTIGDYAFYGCPELTTISIPATVTKVGMDAFAGCTALATADLSGSSLTALPKGIFSGCSALTTVTLPTTLTEIGYGALMGTTSLTGITLPGSLNNIGDRAFAYSGLQNITLPAGVDEVGNFAFAHCTALTHVTVSGSTVDFGNGAFFYDPALVSLDLTKMHNMPDFIFTGGEALNISGSNLSNIESIGDYALMDNPSSNVTLAGNLSYVGSHAMENMSNLTEINATALNDNVPEVGEEAFAGLDQHSITLKVAGGKEGAWNSADQWKEFNIQAVTSIAIVDDGNPEAIKAWISNGQLQVTAPEDIVELNIYDIDGTQIAALHPGSSKVTQDISHLNSRIYIVGVKTAKAARTFKLMR